MFPSSGRRMIGTWSLLPPTGRRRDCFRSCPDRSQARRIRGLRESGLAGMSGAMHIETGNRFAEEERTGRADWFCLLFFIREAGRGSGPRSCTRSPGRPMFLSPAGATRSGGRSRPDPRPPLGIHGRASCAAPFPASRRFRRRGRRRSPRSARFGRIWAGAGRPRSTCGTAR